MNNELIDEAVLTDGWDSPEIKNRKNTVRIVSGILFVLILAISPFCYQEIVGFILFYCKFRYKMIVGLNIHGMVSSFFLASIPVIAYNIWLKDVSKGGVWSYLVLFVCSALMYCTLFIAGLELIFAGSHPASADHPLLPSYVILPPFSFVYDLLFILAALLSFLLLQLIYRIKNRITGTSNT